MLQNLKKLCASGGKWKDARGAFIVEFAVIFPLFIMLIFGIIEFGLLIYNKQILTNATREGARAGVQQAAPPGVTQSPNRYTRPQILAEVQNYCISHLITFSRQANPLTFENADDGYVDQCTPAASPPEKLQVKISYDYQFLVLPHIVAGLFNGNLNDGITLNADTIMTCE